MLTQSGIPKPVYHAMKMLADAGDQRIDLGGDATWGEIGIAAFKGNDAIQVLVFRQKMKNLDLPKEKVKIQVEIPNALSKVLLRRIDQEHGNPLLVWEQMGKPVDLNKTEVEDIIRKSAVTDEEWPYIYEDGMLNLQADLAVNDVYYFQIFQK